MNLRYHIARFLIHLGLRIMPDSYFKYRLLSVLWQLNKEVHDQIERFDHIIKDSKDADNR